jgi:pyruvate/2-oxoglutarate dehydrogenase complex dihydrolipoamide dehydrogenase (E3) component
MASKEHSRRVRGIRPAAAAVHIGGRLAPDEGLAVADRHDLVLVGVGSAGLVAAEFATKLGIRPVAIEAHRIGGDCLWTGCVPSKALLAAARTAHAMRTADTFGIEPVEPDVDLAKVWRRIREVQQRIGDTDDSPEHLEELGVEVVHGRARITGPGTVEADGRTFETKNILLCTGSRPAVPPIDGLEEAGYLTSETIWELENPPESFTVIGGGPIASELAQGLNRLGVEVAVLEQADRLLARDEPELAEIVTDTLKNEGVSVHTNVKVQRVATEGGAKVVHGTENGEPKTWRAEEILVAAGRTPNVDGLGLEELGVSIGTRGVIVDNRLRTSVPSIYAVGDLAGRSLFTHSAGYEAALAVRDMFFPGKAKADELVPWCTFTEPELAHAGLTTQQAIEEHGEDDVEVFRSSLEHSDRARADGTENGAIVLVTAKDKLVGAHIAAPNAGEMIHECVLAIREGTKLRDLATMIHVYPTYTTSLGLLAAEASYERAQRLKWLVRK